MHRTSVVPVRSDLPTPHTPFSRRVAPRIYDWVILPRRAPELCVGLCGYEWSKFTERGNCFIWTGLVYTARLLKSLHSRGTMGNVVYCASLQKRRKRGVGEIHENLYENFFVGGLSYTIFVCYRRFRNIRSAAWLAYLYFISEVSNSNFFLVIAF